nr:3'-5' exonuclease [Dyella sp. SG609]
MGAEVICGAAGSGKTSTALLRLRSLCLLFGARRKREGSREPIRVLVLTFNRTLAGYIAALAKEQFDAQFKVELTVDTFAHWASQHLGGPVIHDAEARRCLQRLGERLPPLTAKYVAKEADYLLGRFEPDQVDLYLTSERTGRGNRPRIELGTKRRILDEVIRPYMEWLRSRKFIDWNSLAVMMRGKASLNYDVVVVDESQDFSANQLRAIRQHLARDHSITFVIDTVQRVYARGFTWAECGFQIQPGRSHTLRSNYRNTAEIAQFAAGILQGIAVDSDGALPNLATASRRGSLPIVLRGSYVQQVSWAIECIRQNVNLAEESVAFLKPLGGGWFEELEKRLTTAGLPYVELTRESHWPEGPENIAICTFHSSKGLEFDHVFILGLNGENTLHDAPEVDDEIVVLRKLLAIAIARARQTVTIGYKPGEESKLIQFMQPNTFQVVDL